MIVDLDKFKSFDVGTLVVGVNTSSSSEALSVGTSPATSFAVGSASSDDESSSSAL